MVAPAGAGALDAIPASTYELEPEFLEAEFLPSPLDLGAWDDRNRTSRIDRAAARRARGRDGLRARRARPRPAAVAAAIHPVAIGRGRIRHAKVTLLVHSRAVRLVIGSANLTTAGYCRNREVAAVLRATADDPRHAPMLRDAIAGMRTQLGHHWTEDAAHAAELALARLYGWRAAAPPERAAGSRGAAATTPGRRCTSW